MEKIDVIERAAYRLLQHNVAEARSTIETGYPFSNALDMEMSQACNKIVPSIFLDSQVSVHYICQ